MIANTMIAITTTVRSISAPLRRIGLPDFRLVRESTDTQSG